MSLLITGGDNQKQEWQDEQNALVELKQGGWNVGLGPSTLYAQVPDPPGREVRGYVLRRKVHYV